LRGVGHRHGESAIAIALSPVASAAMRAQAQGELTLRLRGPAKIYPSVRGGNSNVARASLSRVTTTADFFSVLCFSVATIE
jgi:hypothetical protein